MVGAGTGRGRDEADWPPPISGPRVRVTYRMWVDDGSGFPATPSMCRTWSLPCVPAEEATAEEGTAELVEAVLGVLRSLGVGRLEVGGVDGSGRYVVPPTVQDDGLLHALEARLVAVPERVVRRVAERLTDMSDQRAPNERDQSLSPRSPAHPGRESPSMTTLTGGGTPAGGPREGGSGGR